MNLKFPKNAYAAKGQNWPALRPPARRCVQPIPMNKQGRTQIYTREKGSVHTRIMNRRVFARRIVLSAITQKKLAAAVAQKQLPAKKGKSKPIAMPFGASVVLLGRLGRIRNASNDPKFSIFPFSKTSILGHTGLTQHFPDFCTYEIWRRDMHQFHATASRA